jgi:hypothetical protein
MKHSWEAPKGKTFGVAELYDILEGLPGDADIRIACRLNGRPFRVTVETNDGLDNNRPEAVPGEVPLLDERLQAARELAGWTCETPGDVYSAEEWQRAHDLDAQDSRKLGPEGWLRVAREQLAAERETVFDQDSPRYGGPDDDLLDGIGKAARAKYRRGFPNETDGHAR